MKNSNEMNIEILNANELVNVLGGGSVQPENDADDRDVLIWQ